MNRCKFAALRLINTVVILAALSTPSVAGQLTYFGQDASKQNLTNGQQAQSNFFATLSSYGTETLESLAGLADPPLSFGSTGITAATDFDHAYSYTLLAVSGTVALLDQGPAAAGGESYNDTITFNTPVTAFGSFFSQGGDGPANQLTFKLENTSLGTSKLVSVGTLGPNGGFYNVFYFGVTDTDPFDRVTMMESYDYDGILLDNITAGFVKIPFPGDTNGDNIVNFSDLSTLLLHYNQSGTFAMGDFNDSGVVDFSDLSILLLHYNQTAPLLALAVAVPEPTALWLGCLGALGVILLSRVKK